MHPPRPGKQPSAGHWSSVEGSSALCAGVMAWQPPIGLTYVDVLLQREVMAAAFPVRKVALFAQKILTSCLSCSNAFITWHWLPSPTMTMLCTSPGPFIQESYGLFLCGLFLFCRVPAKYSFLIQRAETGPSRPRERAAESKHTCLPSSSN